MKIKVKDLEANPYRDIDKYPIDKTKIEALKTSIQLTTFWDNILARPRPDKKGKYQIAYGHHRLTTLQELKIGEVDIPVRNLSDMTMLQIMANENIDEWRARPAVLIETVLAAKRYLDGELAKYDSWELLDKSIRQLFSETQKYSSKGRFKQLQKDGVGRGTLQKFLGKNYKEHMVQAAIDTLKEDKAGIVDRKAVEQFPKLEQSRQFRSAVKNHKIPYTEQKSLAKNIVKKGVGSRDISNKVSEHPLAKTKSESKPIKKEMPMLDDFIKDIVLKMHDLSALLEKVKGNIKNIQSENKINSFIRNAENLKDILDILIKESKK